MHRISGQITDRLIAEFPPTAAGWSPCRSLKPAARPAAVGYQITGRKRTPFALALLNITGPSLALILVLGVTQAERLLYVAAVLP